MHNKGSEVVIFPVISTRSCPVLTAAATVRTGCTLQPPVHPPSGEAGLHASAWRPFRTPYPVTSRTLLHSLYTSLLYLQVTSST